MTYFRSAHQISIRAQINIPAMTAAGTINSNHHDMGNSHG